jgi:GT2 family glycosyltransferase
MRWEGAGTTPRRSSGTIVKPIFLGVPCFREDPERLVEAIKSFEDPSVDVFLIDNGAILEVKQVLLANKTARVIHNPRNVYINPAWNQLAKRFLESGREILVLANADVVLSRGWGIALLRRSVEYAVRVDRSQNHEHTKVDKELWFGVLSTLELVRTSMEPSGEATGEDSVNHTAGFFFAMPRALVEIIFPIPEEILLYYGDDWIWRLAKAAGYTSVYLHDVRVWHGGSISTGRLDERARIIDADMRAWREVVEPKCIAREKELR